MAETVQGLTIELRIYGTLTGADGINQRVNIQKVLAHSDGTGDSQLGTWFYDASRALNATSENLDLAGSLSDGVGGTVSLNNLKIIYAENLDTDAGDTFLLKPGASNPVSGLLGGTTPTLLIPPGGFILYYDPAGSVAVTGGSADSLAFQSADNSTYKVFIAGDNA